MEQKNGYTKYNKKSNYKYNDSSKKNRKDFTEFGKEAGVLLLRLWLAFRLIAAGIAKFQSPPVRLIENPETGEFIREEGITYGLEYYKGIPDEAHNYFSQLSFMPDIFLNAFSYAIGPFIIALGLLLLLGIKTKLSLIATGILFIFLTIGLTFFDKTGTGAAYVAIHIVIVFLALKHIKFNCLYLLK